MDILIIGYLIKRIGRRLHMAKAGILIMVILKLLIMNRKAIREIIK